MARIASEIAELSLARRQNSSASVWACGIRGSGSSIGVARRLPLAGGA
jgi:hypothetical protein